MVLLLLCVLEEHKENMHRGILKKRIFRTVSERMAEEGYNLTYDEVLRKWHNLLQTYRKYKNRRKQSGAGRPVSWPYYDVSIYFGFIVFLGQHDM